MLSESLRQFFYLLKQLFNHFHFAFSLCSRYKLRAQLI
ncbi:Uncharacterized protein YR821_2852 [Yersinia ruckeri]|nr:hypothetical protein yruck0001_4660 [Yersinia ruckeri ATCC 29473]QTD77769.1 Uncharacterized protein YR821_2852 [Yersinia ruckeri]